MATFLPFVNKDSPIHEVADKICQRHGGLPLASRLQLLNIVVSVGVEKIEEKIAREKGSSSTFVSIILREFSYVAPIPSNTLLVALYFIDYVNQIHPEKTYWSKDYTSHDALILHLAVSFSRPDALVTPSKNKSVPTTFKQKDYCKNIASKKYFSSDTKAKVMEFCCPEELEAYLLLAAVEPIKMFETLNSRGEPVFTKPVRAVVKSEE